MPFGGTVVGRRLRVGHQGRRLRRDDDRSMDFAIQTKGESTLKGLDTWHAKAEGKAT